MFIDKLSWGVALGDSNPPGPIYLVKVYYVVIYMKWLISITLVMTVHAGVVIRCFYINSLELVLIICNKKSFFHWLWNGTQFIYKKMRYTFWKIYGNSGHSGSDWKPSSIYSWSISHIFEHEFFCLGCLGWAGSKGKKVALSFSEQLLRVVFSTFCGTKKEKKIWKHCSVRTKKLHKIK